MTQHQIERRAGVRAELTTQSQVMRDLERLMNEKASYLVRHYGAGVVAGAHIRMMQTAQKR